MERIVFRTPPVRGYCSGPAGGGLYGGGGGGFREAVKSRDEPFGDAGRKTSGV